MSDSAPSAALLDQTLDPVWSSWKRGAVLYLRHPFLHAARYFGFMVRKAWPGRAMRFKDGRGHRYVTMKNNFTSFAVAVLGERDPHLMEFLRRWVRPGDVVCDVGANIGTYTVPLAELVGPTGRVVAFEPNRRTCACLVKNVRQNRLANVAVVRRAVGDRIGRQELVLNDKNFGEVHLAPVGRSGACGAIAGVAVTTLDAELARLTWPQINYLKIDVEGYELAALRGAVKTLAASDRLVVQTEIVPAHAARYGFSVADLAAFFASLGYRPFSCGDDGRIEPVDLGRLPAEADWFWARSENVFR